MTTNFNIAILWEKLSYSGSDFMGRKSKKILNDINGYFSFGTINAIMGPSGSGKSTILKCLNGQIQTGLSLETKLYTERNQDLRSCFIVQDVTEHLFFGITVNEWLIYSSKLKNSNEHQEIDHQSNVSKLKEDLLLIDSQNTLIKNCSGGELKRIVIASELTAIRKPNLICIDEPTSGLDSNAAEIVMFCLNKLSHEQNISIVTSIHQPNAEILMIFDSLYVLAKGGKCVYFGAPSAIRKTLSECEIILKDFEIPIEILIKNASKGIENETVQNLVDHSVRKMEIIINQNNVMAKLSILSMRKNTLKFSFSDTRNLFIRSLTDKLVSQGVGILIQILITFLLEMLICFMGNRNHGKIDSCIDILGESSSNTSCYAGLEGVKLEFAITQNITLIFLMGGILQFVQVALSGIIFSDKIEIFLNEIRNGWYSGSCYYWAVTLLEIPIPIITSIICVYTSYTLSNQLNDGFRLVGTTFIIIIGVLCCQGIGFLNCILLNKKPQLVIMISLITFILIMFFEDYFVPLTEMHPILKFLSNFSFMKQTFHSSLIYIYGFDRCKSGTVSWVLLQFEINENEYFRLITNIILVIIHFITMRIIILIILITKLNSK